MNGKLYWINRLLFLLTNFACMIALTLYLMVCGNSVSSIALILILWCLLVAVGMGIAYWKRKRQMEILLTLPEKLTERNLISEVMEL